jgi:hypothetical protein
MFSIKLLGREDLSRLSTFTIEAFGSLHTGGEPSTIFVSSTAGFVPEDVILNCRICRLVQHMISYAFGENSVSTIMLADYSNFLFFGAHRKQSSSTGAIIYIQFKVGDEGMSICEWVIT